MSWSSEWRERGIVDKRFDSPEEAIAAAKRVRAMKPSRHQGRREAKSKRPNFITAERVHHSRGKKWEEFLEATGYNKLSPQDQQIIFDSFNLGGSELFQQWKQREYEKWTPIESVRVLEYHNRKVVMVQMADGRVVEQPYKEDEKTKKSSFKARKTVIPPSVASNNAFMRALQKKIDQKG